MIWAARFDRQIGKTVGLGKGLGAAVFSGKTVFGVLEGRETAVTVGGDTSVALWERITVLVSVSEVLEGVEGVHATKRTRNRKNKPFFICTPWMSANVASAKPGKDLILVKKIFIVILI